MTRGGRAQGNAQVRSKPRTTQGTLLVAVAQPGPTHPSPNFVMEISSLGGVRIESLATWEMERVGRG